MLVNVKLNTTFIRTYEFELNGLREDVIDTEVFYVPERDTNFLVVTTTELEERNDNE